MAEKKRIFTGVKIDFTERTQNFYSSAKDALNESDIKWTEPENMHITLKFLGDVQADKIPKISAKLKNIAKSHDEFKPLLKGVGVFKDFYRPKILWFGLRNCPEFEKIKNGIENSLSDIGFEIDYRKFNSTPHGRKIQDLGLVRPAEEICEHEQGGLSSGRSVSVTLFFMRAF